MEARLSVQEYQFGVFGGRYRVVWRTSIYAISKAASIGPWARVDPAACPGRSARRRLHQDALMGQAGERESGAGERVDLLMRGLKKAAVTQPIPPPIADLSGAQNLGGYN